MLDCFPSSPSLPASSLVAAAREVKKRDMSPLFERGRGLVIPRFRNNSRSSSKDLKPSAKDQQQQAEDCPPDTLTNANRSLQLFTRKFPRTGARTKTHGVWEDTSRAVESTGDSMRDAQDCVRSVGNLSKD